VFTDTFLETNGISTFYKTLLKWCPPEGKTRVNVICPARPDLDEGEIDSRVTPVRPRIAMPMMFYRDLVIGVYSLRKLSDLVSRSPNRKLVHIATSGPLGTTGSKLARRLGLPLVGVYHTLLGRFGGIYGGSMLGRPGAWLGETMMRAVDRRAYKKCDMMFVASDAAQEETRKFYSGPTTRIPIAVDLDRFTPAANRDGEFRKKYQRKGTALVIWVGRMAKEKNLDQVCELLLGDERISLVFVGDGPYREELQKRWDVPVTGFLHGDELIRAFQQADMFVHLSKTESFGLSLVEALGTGLPALVLKAGGFVETLNSRPGIQILDPEELHTLGDRCVALAEDHDGLQAASEDAREIARVCSAENLVPTFLEHHRDYALDDKRESARKPIQEADAVESTL
jgi:glycosyltransferase involved in cell wall biosynthesis